MTDAIGAMESQSMPMPKARGAEPIAQQGVVNPNVTPEQRVGLGSKIGGLLRRSSSSSPSNPDGILGSQTNDPKEVSNIVDYASKKDSRESAFAAREKRISWGNAMQEPLNDINLASSFLDHRIDEESKKDGGTGTSIDKDLAHRRIDSGYRKRALESVSVKEVQSSGASPEAVEGEIVSTIDRLLVADAKQALAQRLEAQGAPKGLEEVAGFTNFTDNKGDSYTIVEQNEAGLRVKFPDSQIQYMTRAEYDAKVNDGTFISTVAPEAPALEPAAVAVESSPADGAGKIADDTIANEAKPSTEFNQFGILHPSGRPLQEVDLSKAQTKSNLNINTAQEASMRVLRTEFSDIDTRLKATDAELESLIRNGANKELIAAKENEFNGLEQRHNYLNGVLNPKTQEATPPPVAAPEPAATQPVAEAVVTPAEAVIDPRDAQITQLQERIIALEKALNIASGEKLPGIETDPAVQPAARTSENPADPGERTQDEAEVDTGTADDAEADDGASAEQSADSKEVANINAELLKQLMTLLKDGATKEAKAQAAKLAADANQEQDPEVKKSKIKSLFEFLVLNFASVTMQAVGATNPLK